MGPDLLLTAHTVRGPVRFLAQGKPGERDLQVAIPPGCDAELVVRREEHVPLPPASTRAPAGHLRYRLPAGVETRLQLHYA